MGRYTSSFRRQEERSRLGDASTVFIELEFLRIAIVKQLLVGSHSQNGRMKAPGSRWFVAPFAAAAA